MVIKLFSKKQNNFLHFTTYKFYKRKFCNTLSDQSVSSNYKYLLILDFEATCDNSRPKNKPHFQEIIEFPCLKINLHSFLEEGRFHHYVRPVFQPILSNFCVELTGIIQDMVDNAQTFPEVFKLFEDWRRDENLTETNSVYITSGDWDLGHMIPEQCALSELELPTHMKTWIDIKKLFAYNNNKFYNSFTNIMQYYNLEFEGRAHSGIDDCLNMLRVVRKMGEAGVEFKPTTRLNDNKVEPIKSYLKEEVKDTNGPAAITSKYFKRRRG